MVGAAVGTDRPPVGTLRSRSASSIAPHSKSFASVFMNERKPTVYLIDAPIYVFRAYFSLPDTLVDPAGRPINAVYGFAQFLCNLLTTERPTHVAAAFDESLTSSFRNEWYPAYKANRELPPESLVEQFRACKRVCRALGVRTFASRRYEADDLIATLAERVRRRGFRVVIVSRDKDLAQLVRPGDRLWDGLGGASMDVTAVKERFGVSPRQLPDYQALVGDTADNIPGVPGIGPKAAAALLQRFGSLNGVYEKVTALEKLGIRGAATIMERLELYREQAFLSRRLATLLSSARIRGDADSLAWPGTSPQALNRVFRELGVGPRLSARCDNVAAAG
jgi:DNA polymerase-1